MPDVFSGAKTVRLGDLAWTRSGDKGSHANLGVVARDAMSYAFLEKYLTAELVQRFFAWTGVTRVERYLLANVGAINFVLYGALAGGAARSLRWDSQGKLFGTAAQELRIVLPDIPIASEESPP
ncbi:MAG: hypothetical protein KatS3mg110_3082 [Pirellulaceae bacterium]|nr:MAG: hypothetical protein KatS3mg110_3082 [Pirellulaceae bacterium]